MQRRLGVWLMAETVPSVHKACMATSSNIKIERRNNSSFFPKKYTQVENA